MYTHKTASYKKALQGARRSRLLGSIRQQDLHLCLHFKKLMRNNNMEAKTLILFLAVSLTILQHQVAAAQPSPEAEHRCSSRSPVQKKLISVSESKESALHCTKTEGKRPQS